ncbi:hypothetical protein C6A85_15095, partial [Mycobacterium sp. ITM-2017-0098]
PLLAAFALIPRAQLDVAASLGASPWTVLRNVVMPEAWPALAATSSWARGISANAASRGRTTNGVKNVISAVMTPAGV